MAAGEDSSAAGRPDETHVAVPVQPAPPLEVVPAPTTPDTRPRQNRPEWRHKGRADLKGLESRVPDLRPFVLAVISTLRLP